jgi:hypothetical protein
MPGLFERVYSGVHPGELLLDGGNDSSLLIGRRKWNPDAPKPFKRNG